jgi:hypothetical protein
MAAWRRSTVGGVGFSKVLSYTRVCLWACSFLTRLHASSVASVHGHATSVPVNPVAVF